MKYRPLGASARTDVAISLGFRRTYSLGDAANAYERGAAGPDLGQRARRL